MQNDGYIKFNCDWIRAEPPEERIISELNFYRSKLFILKLIGMDPNGVGFGNVSIRFKENQFIISGTQTGSKEILQPNDYSLVTKFDIKKNYLECRGELEASSESLTHGIIYKSCTEANAVIHTHNYRIWRKLMNRVPATTQDAEFGTPELAFEIEELFKKNNVNEERIIIMGGHQDGIITFGKDIEEAYNILINNCEN